MSPSKEGTGLLTLTHLKKLKSFSSYNIVLNACFRRTSHRRPHPIEREMDQAIKDSQNKQSNTSMDERVKVRRPSVKQKYMGHRNARCVRSQRIQKFHLFSSLLNKLRTASILVEEISLLYCFCSSLDISSRSS